MAFSWSLLIGTVFGLVANFLFLLGCISPPTQELAIYRVNVTLLADGLQKLAFNSSGNASQLLNPALPTYWYWGMSGICDVYETKDETRCRRMFPPTQSVLDILQDSLRDGLGSDQQQSANGIITSWNATLNNISPSKLSDKEAKSAAQIKGSAALVVLAIVFDFFIPLLALVLQNPSNNAPYYLSYGTCGLTIGSGALAVLSMMDGIHGVIDTGEREILGAKLLFIGAALKFVIVTIACCSSRSGRRREFDTRPGFPPPAGIPLGPRITDDLEAERAERNKEIGYFGELYVYNWLANRIPEWSYENWTSKLRSLDGGLPAFTENERDYADFTYDDYNGRMRAALHSAGAWVTSQSPRARYHLEVKTTPAGITVPFFISPNQVQMMRRYRYDPNNIYVIARVLGVGKGYEDVRFFPSPLDNGGLYFGEQKPDGYYPVYIRS